MTANQNRRTRTARGLGRIRPHLARRNGLVDGPQDHTPRSDYQRAVSIGWRPTG